MVCVCRRGGTPEAGRESPRMYTGVLRPEFRVVAPAEKEKEGSASTSSVEGSTWSEDEGLLGGSGWCSLVVCRLILLFFEEDVLMVSCLLQLERHRA